MMQIAIFNLYRSLKVHFVRGRTISPQGLNHLTRALSQGGVCSCHETADVEISFHEIFGFSLKTLCKTLSTTP